MVAYSFKQRFIEPILAGLGERRPAIPKRQTVRAFGKKRHAKPGEFIQLYSGQRTRGCQRLGEAVCTRTTPIKIEFKDGVDVYIDGCLLTEDETLAFVVDDGFLTTDDFIMFWDENHGLDKPFEGIIIYWEPKK